MADPGFSKTGRGMPKLLFGKIFYRKLQQIEEIGPIGGGGSVPYTVYEEHAILTDPKIVL